MNSFRFYSFQEIVLGFMFAMSSVSLSLFVFIYFCASRQDVQECFRRFPAVFRTLFDKTDSPKFGSYNYNIPGSLQTKDTIDGVSQRQTLGTTENVNPPISAQSLFQESHPITHGTQDLNFGLEVTGGHHGMGTIDYAGETRPFLPQSESATKQYTLPNLPPPQHPNIVSNQSELPYATSENAVGVRTQGYIGAASKAGSLKPGNISRTGSNVASTASRARIKVNNMFGGGNKNDLHVPQKESDMSSEHLSVNNMNHLRRGYVAPVNSEAEYSLAGGSTAPMLPPPPPPPPIINADGSARFGQISNTNHPNALAGTFASNSGHFNHHSRNRQNFPMGMQPKTSSPTAGHAVPFTDQDLTVSPLVNQNQGDIVNPYDMMPLMNENFARDPLMFNNGQEEGDMSFNTGPVLMDLSGESNIRVGDPCQIMSYATADLPSGMSSIVPSSNYGSPYPSNLTSRFEGMPPPGFVGAGGKSASLPRRPLYPRSERKQSRHKNQRGGEDGITRLSDVEDDSKSTGRYSAISMGSTAYSSRSGHSSKSKKHRDKHRKKPNRRRQRRHLSNDDNAKSNSTNSIEHTEPFYNNLETNGGGRGRKLSQHQMNPEDEYLGDHDCDGDQFDSLERYQGGDHNPRDQGRTNQDSVNSRNVCNDPLIEQSETEGNATNTSDVAREESEDPGNPSSNSQYSSHSHFSSSDIPKRETSV